MAKQSKNTKKDNDAKRKGIITKNSQSVPDYHPKRDSELYEHDVKNPSPASKRMWDGW